MRAIVELAQTMNAKSKAVITNVVAAVILGGALVLLKHRSTSAVTVTLRIAVTPADQATFVTARANSAQFKYLVGKQCGIKPRLAQKLALQPVANSVLVEARIDVPTKDEAKRYVEAFLPTLQDLCGQQVKLALASQSIR